MTDQDNGLHSLPHMIWNVGRIVREVIRSELLVVQRKGNFWFEDVVNVFVGKWNESL